MRATKNLESRQKISRVKIPSLAKKKYKIIKCKESNTSTALLGPTGVGSPYIFFKVNQQFLGYLKLFLIFFLHFLFFYTSYILTVARTLFKHSVAQIFIITNGSAHTY